MCEAYKFVPMSESGSFNFLAAAISMQIDRMPAQTGWLPVLGKETLTLSHEESRSRFCYPCGFLGLIFVQILLKDCSEIH